MAEKKLNGISMKKNQPVFVVIPIIFLVLQQALLNYTSGIINALISYFDEFYVVFLWIISLSKNKGKIKFNKTDSTIAFLTLIFAILGLLSNLQNDFQESVFWIFIDFYTCIKFSLCYLGIRQYLYDYESNKKILNKLYKFAKSYTIILFLLSMVNIVLPIFPKADFRYFMYSIRLFYPHPTYLAISAIFCVCVIIAKNSYNENKKDILLIVLGLLVAAMTLRSKAIAGALCILLFYIYFVALKLKNKVVIGLSAFGIAFYIGYDQLVFYFGGNSKYNLNFIRERLLIDSFSIAKAYFPLGSGFGTFASNVAAEHWSKLYNIYNYSYNAFLSDSFWPIIIAQCGWIGCILFILILANYLKIVLNLQKVSIYLMWAGISILIYEIICSVGESAFFNPAVCPMFLILGIIINLAERRGVYCESIDDHKVLVKIDEQNKKIY
ncbi:MAG: hypothetical protein IJZ34_02315 [Lachnospiraceae bacterium]|nr:hypothetical protein [Lachnospiraceae bacterium]